MTGPIIKDGGGQAGGEIGLKRGGIDRRDERREERQTETGRRGDGGRRGEAAERDG